MASKKQRVAALATALFFLGATAVTTVAVLWTIFSQRNANKSATANTAQQTPQVSPKVGTKLADFSPVASVPKLQIIDTKIGTGATAQANSSITVDYTGALAKDGTIFDASLDGQPATLTLSQVIEGWQKGVPGMKVGGTRRLLIPAAQAYGNQSPAASIPANSDLVFDITLVAVK